MLEVRDLELVEAVTTHGNFTRAARVLGVNQPALTRHVAALEQRLGGVLFIRRNQGIEETALCRALKAEAGDLLSRFRALSARMGHARGEHSHEVAIVAGTYAAETIGMAALGRMVTLRPDVQVRFTSVNYVQALARLRDREAELAIIEISEFEAEPDLVIEPLRRHRGAFAARASHPLVDSPNLTLPDIVRFPICLISRMPDRIAQPFIAARQAAHQTGHSCPAYPARIIESPTAALLAVRASDMLVAVTGSLIAPWLSTGEIKVLQWQEPWLATNFGIVHLRTRPPSPTTVTFIECLRQADQEAEADDAALLVAVGARTADHN